MHPCVLPDRQTGSWRCTLWRRIPMLSSREWNTKHVRKTSDRYTHLLLTYHLNILYQDDCYLRGFKFHSCKLATLIIYNHLPASVHTWCWFRILLHIQSLIFLRLENWCFEEWGDQVTVVSCDMREWAAPEKADIIVSELLGSFGDNELSPECLDGAQHFLKGTVLWLKSFLSVFFV